MQEMSIFSNTFFASSIVSSLASARKNPHPCLASALGPQHQHTHMSFGASFCPSLLRTTGNEKSTERKNPVFPRREVCMYVCMYVFIYLSFCLELLIVVERFSGSLFLPSSFSFMSISPSSCGGFTCFSSISCALCCPPSSCTLGP